VPAIAARFGVSEATVEKRLRLGRVAPAILDAYRAGDIGLEQQVQAFALSTTTRRSNTSSLPAKKTVPTRAPSAAR
jgi:hypothetical protein